MTDCDWLKRFVFVLDLLRLETPKFSSLLNIAASNLFEVLKNSDSGNCWFCQLLEQFVIYFIITAKSLIHQLDTLNNENHIKMHFTQTETEDILVPNNFITAGLSATTYKSITFSLCGTHVKNFFSSFIK